MFHWVHGLTASANPSCSCRGYCIKDASILPTLGTQCFLTLFSSFFSPSFTGTDTIYSVWAVKRDRFAICSTQTMGAKWSRTKELKCVNGPWKLISYKPMSRSADKENLFGPFPSSGTVSLSTSTDMATYLRQCGAPSLEVSFQML